MITDEPVYMCERGGGGRGPESVGSETLSLLVIHTSIRQSHGLSQTMSGWTEKTDEPVYIRERGGGGRGEWTQYIDISPVIHTVT